MCQESHQSHILDPTSEVVRPPETSRSNLIIDPNGLVRLNGPTNHIQKVQDPALSLEVAAIYFGVVIRYNSLRHLVWRGDLLIHSAIHPSAESIPNYSTVV